MATPHVPDEGLERYAMGAMRGELVAELEEHLLACPVCQDRLAETRRFLSVFRAAAVQLEPLPRPRSRGLLVLAATVAAALVIFVITKKHDPNALVPATVVMDSMRGLETGARIPAGRASVLVFDAAPSAIGEDAQVEIVNPAGNLILTMPGKWNNGRLTVTVGKIGRGSYWVRVYSKATKDLVAEYGLRAE
jgi:hypothetical protein